MSSVLKLLICVGLVLTTTASTKERRKRTLVDLANPLAVPWQYQNNWQLRPTPNVGVPLYDILRVNNYEQNAGVNPNGQVQQLNMYYNVEQPSTQNFIPNIQQQGYIYPGEYRTINVDSLSNIQERPVDLQSQQSQPGITGDYRGIQDYQKLVGSINRYSVLSSYLNSQSNPQIPNQPISSLQEGNLNEQNILGYNPLIKNGQGLIDEGRLSQLSNDYRSKQIQQGNIQQGNIQQGNIQQGNIQQGDIESQLRSNAGLNTDFGRYTQVSDERQKNIIQGGLLGNSNEGLSSQLLRSEISRQVLQGNNQQQDVNQNVKQFIINAEDISDIGSSNQVLNERQKNGIQVRPSGQISNNLNAQLLSNERSKQVLQGNIQQRDVNNNLQQFGFNADSNLGLRYNKQVPTGSLRNGGYLQETAQASRQRIIDQLRQNEVQQNQGKLLGGLAQQQLGSNQGKILGELAQQQLSSNQGKLLGELAQQQLSSNQGQLQGELAQQQLSSNQGKLLGELAQQQLRSNQDRQQAIQASLKDTQADSGASVNANQPQAQPLGPGRYTYSELSGKIMKVLQSNPSMMSNFGDLVDQLLNGSGNPQIKLLKNLLQEIGKYTVGAQDTRQSSQQQGAQNPLVRNLIEVMNKSGVNQNNLLSKGGRWRY
ncbi:uncharacterized protein LOC123683148 [Harmonia axyridis]|uniref:uncharacterized protein LOC123683148 n=1 Tax=Harmonia axyridis TaxID=115357 RepID=UPI001E2762D3|nr:uncharacterized protein LOC123683148 [Harmonia axyridis]